MPSNRRLIIIIFLQGNHDPLVGKGLFFIENTSSWTPHFGIRPFQVLKKLASIIIIIALKYPMDDAGLFRIGSD